MHTINFPTSFSKKLPTSVSILSQMLENHLGKRMVKSEPMTLKHVMREVAEVPCPQRIRQTPPLL